MENNTLEKIENLMKKNNLTANKLAIACKLQNNTFTYWKNGKTKPTIDVLIRIADYFNVSIDYLVGRETPAQIIQNIDITNTDNELNQFITFWKQMDEFQKASVIGYAQGLINKDLTIQKQNKLFYGRTLWK